jgi:hypothetical protein
VTIVNMLAEAHRVEIEETANDGDVSPWAEYLGRVVDRVCRPSNPQAATLMRAVSPRSIPSITPEEKRDLDLIDVQSGPDHQR